MSKKDDQDRDKKIVDALFDLMYDSELKTDVGIDQYLKSRGADPQKLENEGFDFLSDWKRRIKYEAARRKRSLFDQLKARLTENRSADHRRTTIRKLLMPTEPQAKLVFNRKLDDISDEYLETLEDDKALLELWQRFQEESEGS